MGTSVNPTGQARRDYKAIWQKRPRRTAEEAQAEEAQRAVIAAAVASVAAAKEGHDATAHLPEEDVRLLLAATQEQLVRWIEIARASYGALVDEISSEGATT